MTVGVHRAEFARAQTEFEQHLASAAASVGQRIAEDVAYLSATRAFLTTREGEVARPLFADFVRGLGLEGPAAGLQGVGFAQIVTPALEGAVALRLSRDYGADGGVWPDSRAALRTSIVLLEPLDPRNAKAIGYDMATDADRRAAMTAAMADGAPVASAPVTLVQEITGDQQAGILIFLHMPAASDGGPSGFVYSPIRAGELFEAALASVDVTYDLRALDAAVPDKPLFRSAGFTDRGGVRHLTAETHLSVAGRDWTLTAQSREGDGFLQLYPFTLITAAGMALLALTTTLAVQGLTAAVRRARSLNAAQDQLMRDKDLHLREMSHRLKNSLARVTAMARQAARGAETKEDFVASMTLRLQAMANAQDLLTRAAGRIELRSLLQAELRQIFGDGAALPAMTGPEVQLDPRETQALGLSFHELGTNALKYGAGAVEGGKIDIRWTVTRKGAKRVLMLNWEETTGTAMQEPAQKGFGSQLLDSCIRIEMGGTLTRRYHATGFGVEISVPLGQSPDPAQPR